MSCKSFLVPFATLTARVCGCNSSRISNRRSLRINGKTHMLKMTFAAAATALLLATSLATAQAPAPPAGAPAPAATAPPPAPPKAVTKSETPVVAPVKKAAAKKGPVTAADRTPESIACSAELDAKNIHGKPRAAALRKCKADAKKAAATKAPAATKAAAPAPATSPPVVPAPAKK